MTYGKRTSITQYGMTAIAIFVFVDTSGLL